MKEICAIGESGGMRNSFNSGYLLGSGLKPDSIKHVVGVSSSTAMLLNFLGGGIENSFELWTEKLTSPDVYSLANPLRGRPFADLDYILKVVSEGLDLERMFATVKSFVAETVELMTAQPEFMLAGHGNYAQIFKASCALPGATSPVVIDGKEYIDGGAAEQLPVRHAYERGHRKLLVFSNKPGNFEPEPFTFAKSWFFSPRSRACRELLRTRRHLNYHAARSFIADPPRDASVFLVAPPQMPCEVLERNKDEVKKSFELGFNLGRLDSAYLHEWLES